MVIDKGMVTNITMGILVSALLLWAGYTLYQDHSEQKEIANWVRGVIQVQQQAQQQAAQRQVAPPTAPEKK